MRALLCLPLPAYNSPPDHRLLPWTAAMGVGACVCFSLSPVLEPSRHSGPVCGVSSILTHWYSLNVEKGGDSVWHSG